jgi:hypothetical protein
MRMKFKAGRIKSRAHAKPVDDSTTVVNRYRPNQPRTERGAFTKPGAENGKN